MKATITLMLEDHPSAGWSSIGDLRDTLAEGLLRQELDKLLKAYGLKILRTRAVLSTRQK